MYVQEHHSTKQIVGDKEASVHFRRRLMNTYSQVHVAMLSMIEPKLFSQDSLDEN